MAAERKVALAEARALEAERRAEALELRAAEASRQLELLSGVIWEELGGTSQIPLGSG
jgi:hypothetical protein